MRPRYIRSRGKLTFLVSVFVLVVFFVDGFFAVAAFLVVAGAFLGAATGFFVLAVLFADVLDLPRAVFFAGTALVTSVVLAFLDGGWVFCDRLNNAPQKRVTSHTSLVSADTLGRLGASLTLPDGPLGNTNVSFSAPRVSAKLS